MRFNHSGSGWYGFSMYIPDDGSVIGSKTYIGQWHYAGVGSPLRGTSKEPLISQVFAGSASDMLAIKVHHDKGVEHLLMENFKRGQWHDMVYHIKFYSNDSGLLNVWWNGKQVVNYRGPTMYRGSVTFFKFGIYTHRANEMPADNKLVVYFDEYSTGSSYEDVDPSKGSNTRVDL